MTEIRFTAADNLPAEFAVEAYRSRYSDLAHMPDAVLTQHYATTGIAENRNASTVGDRAAFLALIPRTAKVLEIGPFANPAMRGANVKYFDVLGTDDLRARATVHKVDPAKCPHIHFVSPTGDLSVVDETFDVVVSSHVIEHQPDLIEHLRSVGRLLNAGGAYFLAVPDKRYCFDHFIAESSIAEVLAATVRGMKSHDVQHVVEHLALTTHNDAARHWAGDHGKPVHQARPEVIHEALARFVAQRGEYLDVHAWQFSPASFRSIMATLCAFEWIAFQAERVYATSVGSNEFYAVLSKQRDHVSPLPTQAMADAFDAAAYLAANPDVARAGADPFEHYMNFGRKEGRKLRP